MFSTVFGWREVFEVGFAIIERVVVFMMAFIAWRSVHDFSVHTDMIGLAVPDDSTHGVKAVLGADEPIVVVVQTGVVINID